MLLMRWVIVLLSWRQAAAKRARWVLLPLACVVLAACANLGGGATAHRSPETDLQPFANRLLSTPEPVPGWEVFALPGKRLEPFVPAQVIGRDALQVRANKSVSILRQRFSQPSAAVGALSFSWKVDALPAGADLRDAQAEDSPVRVVLAFGGDRARLSPRAHRLSELSRLITGEDLPFATLSYVWSANEPLETVVHNPRTDRIRKLVVASGPAQLGQWLDYRRDVRADFVRAFGEEPGPLLAIALMTDTDNTESALQAWYGALHLQTDASTGAGAPPAVPVLPSPVGENPQPKTGNPG
jgi:hypothetical protein